jgi:protein-tyrosine phosphatase
MAENAQIIVLEGGINFREIGGYPAAHGKRVKNGQLFRSGTTDALTANDRASLAKLAIRTVVDLRSNEERLELPHGLKDDVGVDYRAYDHDRRGGNLLRLLDRPNLQAVDLENAMLHMYRHLAYEFAEVYRDLFQTIAKGPVPLVFNCAAGKDRTGVAAALLLSAIGVSWEDIVEDYLLTRQFVPAIVRKFSSSTLGGKIGRFDPCVVAPVFEVRPSYLITMREAVTARSGSIDEYLRIDLGLDLGLLKKLRQQLLN